MSRIRGRDTKPEMVIRRGLHARGLRFRLHALNLPGRPDLVFPSWGAVIFVHGCFWHGHNCPMFRLPATRRTFWQAKIDGNRQRDGRTVGALAAAGWRHLIVWECALRGPARQNVSDVLDVCERFLAGTADSAELSGRWTEYDGSRPSRQ